MVSFNEPIVAVQLSLDGRTGVTLYAPPWRDTDGEEWQGFLGDGSKIVLLGDGTELAEWLAANPEHDLSDHPVWGSFAKKGHKVLTPADEDDFDFDAVYELAAAEPEPETVSTLADVVDMAVRIADCCEDGALRALLNNTREYALLVEGDTSYVGKDGSREWSELGTVIAGSWERAGRRIGSWLRWEGSSGEQIIVDDDPED
jgi:hypothetical protein